MLGISIPTLTRAKRAIQENRHDLNVRTPRVGTNGVRGTITHVFELSVIFIYILVL